MESFSLVEKLLVDAQAEEHIRTLSVPYSEQNTSKLLTVEELRTLAECTLVRLKEVRDLESSSLSSVSAPIAEDFMSNLLVHTLSRTPPPRSQFFCKLQTSHVAGRHVEGEQLVLILDGKKTKNRKPAVCVLPADIASFYALWLRFLRPVLVSGDAKHNFLFCTKRGLPRTEISSLVKKVTQHVLRREVTAHSFRHSMITALFRSSLWSDHLSEGLAKHMNHSREVQMKSYLKVYFSL